MVMAVMVTVDVIVDADVIVDTDLAWIFPWTVYLATKSAHHNVSSLIEK